MKILTTLTDIRVTVESLEEYLRKFKPEEFIAIPMICQSIFYPWFTDMLEIAGAKTRLIEHYQQTFVVIQLIRKFCLERVSEICSLF